MNDKVAAIEQRLAELITQNRFGLAFDALEELSGLVPCRGGFWRDLERAAMMLYLDQHARYFRERFVSTKPHRE